MAAVIRVENLSKQYRLGEIGTGTVSHDLNRWLAKLRGKPDPFAKVGDVNDRTKKGNSDYVWALRDLSFDIQQGDAVGIIGRNGAGKSTLLKILSRTTLPSTGSVKVKGRIASLLEVGTGFHPEMTGRENIYQNGALLGMSKNEIKRKFDEIVAFSGCERYIDTPVKRYSSGMYVRLAFAVAAHLESEILIVDEVLAVGDAEFQKKCLGKMGEVSKSEGRTVLFVSHNIGAVRMLCNKGIFLENGTLKSLGNVDEVINGYSLSVNNNKTFKSESGILNSVDFNLKDTSTGYNLVFNLLIENKIIDNVVVHVFIKSRGYVLFSSSMEHNSTFEISQGRYIAICEFISVDLHSGSYTVDVIIDIPKTKRLEAYYDIVSFDIEYSSSMTNSLSLSSHIWGNISALSKWALEKK